VEQRRVGEHAVVALSGQSEAQEVLVEHFAARVRASHRDEARRPLQPHGLVAEPPEMEQVPSRSAAEIQDRKGWRRFDVTQQGCAVLADVVVQRPVAEGLRRAVVVAERASADLPEIGPSIHRWLGLLATWCCLL
jgi:hypothetical protein